MRPIPAFRRAAAGLLTSVLLGLPLLAQAAPDTAPAADPISRLLVEKGMIGAAATNGGTASLAQQVRDSATDLVLSAMNFLGVPYRRGGDTEREGFDCSGFTRYVFEHSLGLVLPRRADEQARAQDLAPVAKSELKPGDLVFFNTLRRTFSHVGIYIGEGKFIHAPKPGAQVRIEDMRAAYWDKRFSGARRTMVLDADGPTAAAALPANNR